MKVSLQVLETTAGSLSLVMASWRDVDFAFWQHLQIRSLIRADAWKEDLCVSSWDRWCPGAVAIWSSRCSLAKAHIAFFYFWHMDQTKRHVLARIEPRISWSSGNRANHSPITKDPKSKLTYLGSPGFSFSSGNSTRCGLSPTLLKTS